MVAGQSAPIAVQLPSSAAVAGQPLPSAMVAGQSAPIVGQSPSLAAVAGQPLPSAMVTGQSDPIAGQSPSFGCPALPSFAAVAGQPLPSAPVAGQSASVAGKSPSLAASKHKSPPPDCCCWWSEVLDMEIKGYVNLSDKSGNTVICLLCRDGKGKSDGVIALRRPFSKYYWDGHANGDKHKNLLKQRLGEEELIAKGKMKAKKNQSQLCGFYQSAEKKKKYPRMVRMIMTMMRARRIMTRKRMIVLIMYCRVLPKGEKHWILQRKQAKNYGKQLLTW
jgi:hypothetical protein